MNSPRILIFLLLSAGVLCAQEPAPAPAKLDVVAEIEKLKTGFKTLEAEREKYAGVADHWYLTNLDQLRDERTKAGDLDGLLVIKSERDRVAAKEPASEEQLKAMSPTVRKLRATYDAGLKKIADDAAKRTDVANRSYLAALEALQLRLTKSEAIEDALVVKAEKDRFIAELAARKAEVAVAPPAAPPVVPPPLAPTKTVTAKPSVPARSPGPAKKSDMTESLVGTWRFTWEQNGWNALRDFKANGTFIGTWNGEGTGIGKWEPIDEKILLTYPDGGKDEMCLPIDPKGTKVVGKRGRVLKAVKER